MTKKIEKILKVIDKFLFWTVAVMFCVMVSVVFLQVIFRYVLARPLAWSEELARYLFVWCSFLGGAIAARKGDHIGVEIIQNALPSALKKIAKLAASFLSGAYFAIILYFCIQMWPRMMAQRSPALGMPIAYVYLGIIVGSAIMCIVYLVGAVTCFIGPEEGETA